MRMVLLGAQLEWHWQDYCPSQKSNSANMLILPMSSSTIWAPYAGVPPIILQLRSLYGCQWVMRRKPVTPGTVFLPKPSTHILSDGESPAHRMLKMQWAYCDQP